MRKGPARSRTFLADMKYGPTKTDTPPEFSLRNEHAEVSRQTKTQNEREVHFWVMKHVTCFHLVTRLLLSSQMDQAQCLFECL